MRVCLAVHRVSDSVERNLQEILAGVRAAARLGADLVMFSEAALTGLVNDDDPEHDAALGTPVRGPLVRAVCDEARRLSVNVALGVLELDGARLLDSALLIDRSGAVACRYRRVTPGWHGPDANPAFYGEGTEVRCHHVDFGRVTFLVCGDLFDDRLVDAVRAEGPDLLLVPLARAFAGGGRSQERWDRDELPQYLARVRRAATTSLLVNYLDDDYFGGAMAVAADGRLVRSLPLGQEGILTVDL